MKKKIIFQCRSLYPNKKQQKCFLSILDEPLCIICTLKTSKNIYDYLWTKKLFMHIHKFFTFRTSMWGGKPLQSTTLFTLLVFHINDTFNIVFLFDVFLLFWLLLVNYICLCIFRFYFVITQALSVIYSNVLHSWFPNTLILLQTTKQVKCIKVCYRRCVCRQLMFLQWFKRQNYWENPNVISKLMAKNKQYIKKNQKKTEEGIRVLQTWVTQYLYLYSNNEVLATELLIPLMTNGSPAEVQTHW